MKKTNTNKFFGLMKNKNLFLLAVLLIFWWSFLYRVDIGSSDVFHDRDQDGLMDEEEYMYGTDINNPDSDGDGYRDGVEVESGYDPLKPAPDDKIFFENKKILTQINNKETKLNLTNEFFAKLSTEKSSELDLLGNYYNNPDSFQKNEENLSALSNISLTSEEMDNFIQETISNSGAENKMKLIPEDDIIILDEVKGNKKKVEKEEKEQIEKYLTQLLYILSINKPFTVEEQSLLPQIGVSYINNLNLDIQEGQISQLTNLKEKAQKSYDEFIKIKTPFKTKDIHIRALSVIKYIIESINEEKLIDQQDPITMALYVGKLQAAMVEFEALKNEIDEMTEEYGIDLFKSQELEGLF